MKLDASVHKVLQDVGGESLAPSLVRAIESGCAEDNHLLVVSLPGTLHDFLIQRTSELNKVSKLQTGGSSCLITPEMVLRDLVKFYAKEAKW